MVWWGKERDQKERDRAYQVLAYVMRIEEQIQSQYSILKGITCLSNVQREVFYQSYEAYFSITTLIISHMQQQQPLLPNQPLPPQPYPTHNPPLQPYTLLPPDGLSQHLQITLSPSQTTHLRGHLLYSNHLQPKYSTFGENLLLNRVLSRPVHMHQWTNTTSQIQVIGLMHLSKKGTMLVLDMQVYREDLFISAQHIVACKSGLEKKVEYHKVLPHMFAVKNQAKDRREVGGVNPIVLQANSPIVQKYLAVGQQFILYPGVQTMAMSQSLTLSPAQNNPRPVTISGKSKPIKITGPGWLFFQSTPLFPKAVNISRAVYVFFAIYIVLALLGFIIADTI